MICLKCVHSIIRTTWDGVQSNDIVNCELDNVRTPNQMSACSRYKEKEQVIHFEPLEPVIPEKIVEPVKEAAKQVVKKKGWPKGKKRGT